MSDDTDPSAIWANDRLDRQSDAKFLKTFLINRVAERQAAGQPASYVLNIDARWGQGKSFFLERFGKMLANDGFLVAQVNAWQDDHADDPLLSVMDAIDNTVAPLVKKERKARDRWNEAKRTGAAIAVAAAKGGTLQLARKVIGTGADEIVSLWGGSAGAADKTVEEMAAAISNIVGEQGKALLASFRESKRTIAEFRKNVAAFLKVAHEKDQSLPLFVLVDELDRCRPPFAIAMLERMKHLFDIDGVVFVVATDTAQLSHSIGAVYGSEFDGSGYLSRFFNRSYHFEESSRISFVEGLLIAQPIDEAKLSLPADLTVIKFLTDAFDYYALPLRNIEQVYDILRSFVTTWTIECKIELAPLLPIIVAHQAKSDLPIDGRFGGLINQLAQRMGGAKTPWRIRFVAASHRGPEESASGVELANDFINQALRPMKDIFEANYSAAHGRWVKQRLGDEFQRLYNNQFVDEGPFSVILRYPEMVRSAGRLSQKV